MQNNTETCHREPNKTKKNLMKPQKFFSMFLLL